MPWLDDLQVFCADIGSVPQGRFAWARRIPASADEEAHEPESIEAMAAAVSRVLDAGAPVAVGFEAPLFVPVPDDPNQLGKARPCDAPSPAWSSGPGSAVLATASVQVPWVLRYIHDRVPTAPIHFRWDSFATAREGVLVWEAFVSGVAKGTTHEEDARNAVEAFCEQLPPPGVSAADETPRPFSLAAAAAAWAGWDIADLDLRTPCLLVRAAPR